MLSNLHYRLPNAVRCIPRRPVSNLSGLNAKDSALFNLDTVVTQSSNNKSKFTAQFTDNWSIANSPNGGYQMAIAISATRKVIGFNDPLSMSAYYFNKANENEPVDIDVQTLNASKGSASVSVSFSQQGILRSQYMGTFGSLDAMKGLDFNNMMQSAPELPPPEECIDCSARIEEIMGGKLPVMARIQFRAPPNDPKVEAMLAGKPGTDASLNWWVRFEDDDENAAYDNALPSLRSMAFFCDVLPPPILCVVHSNWVPTLEYTVHFWQRPTEASRMPAVPAATTNVNASTGTQSSKKRKHYWLRCRYTTPIVIKSVLYLDVEMWSEDGKHLLATSRQLARVLIPRK